MARPSPSRGGARFERLSADIEALRSEVAMLRGALAGEIRARRVILTDEDGFERIVLEANGGFGRVTLYGRTADGGATCVEMFANDPVDGHGAHVGIALTDDENVVAVLEVVERDPPCLWIGDDPEGPAEEP